MSERDEMLAQDRMKQIDYSIDLQRIIEDLCHGRPIRKPKTGARHHYNMAVAYRSTATPAPGYARGFEACREAAKKAAWSAIDPSMEGIGRECAERAISAIAALPAPAGVEDWQLVETAPKDGTPIIGAFWSIRWADSHRNGDVVTCWWQPEFEAFISSCREMTLAPGLTFENGSSRELHSPVIEPITHWRPLDRPIITRKSQSEAGS